MRGKFHKKKLLFTALAPRPIESRSRRLLAVLMTFCEFFVLGSLQFNLLCIVEELACDRSVTLAVGVSDR